MHTEFVAWVTGKGSPNHTDTRWEVAATDVGTMWDDSRGGILIAFGDTFHPPQRQGGGGGGDWRSNVLARATDHDLSRGVIIESMVTDSPGHAREILPSKKIDGDEMTVIPTGGVSLAHRQYLAYMSVREWGDPGRWTTNHSGIAWSDDHGETWTKDPVAKRDNSALGDPQFQMLTPLRWHDGWIYVFGTPCGRGGPAYLARVPQHHLLNPAMWEYWTGEEWGGRAAAEVVVPAPVGELSVMHHQVSGLWLLTHHQESTNTVVLRTAPDIVGPWSEPHTAVTADDYPGLYCPMFVPWTAADPDPMILLSQWKPYNVMALRLMGLDEQPSHEPESAWSVWWTRMTFRIISRLFRRRVRNA